MNKLVISSIVLSSIISGSTAYAVAECPIEFKPFTEEECKTYKNLQEAKKKKDEKVNKCNKDGADAIDGDNNANHDTVKNETTSTLANCAACEFVIQDNISAQCSEFGQDRQVTQMIRIDAEQKQKRSQQLQLAHLTASQSANKARKTAGYKEETRSNNRAHERIEQARIMADTNTITETGVGNVTTLKREGERVDSSVMTALRLYQWLKRFSIFG